MTMLVLSSLGSSCLLESQNLLSITNLFSFHPRPLPSPKLPEGAQSFLLAFPVFEGRQRGSPTTSPF